MTDCTTDFTDFSEPGHIGTCFFYSVSSQDETENVFVQNKDILTKTNYDVIPP